MRFNLEVLKQNNFSIHKKINFRASYSYFLNCINLRIQLLTETKVGTLLRPYEHTLLYNQQKILEEIERDRAFYGGKTRYEFENNL